MGDGIISNVLYCNGKPIDLTPKEVDLDLECEEIELGSPSIEFMVKINAQEWRKMMGYISQKRFRKLLYSIGYGRNAVNEIIKIEWLCKKCYRRSDVKYWKSIMEEN